MKFTSYLIFIGLLLFTSTCSAQKSKNTFAETIFYNGDIITMEGSTPEYVEAVAIKSGKIIFVGSKKSSDKFRSKNTIMIDLKGKTLMPGFVDGHAHITSYADEKLNANLSPYPMGNVSNIKDIILELQKIKIANKLSDTDLIQGSGYDQNFLEEKRHPTAAELDQAFPTNPVILKHASGHMIVCNSAAFKMVGITKDTPNPVGGTFIKDKNNELEGLVQETAMQPFIPFASKPLPLEQEFEKLINAQKDFAAFGVTTATEHLATLDKINLLKNAAQKNKLILDIIVLPAYLYAKDLIENKKLNWGTYYNRLKFQGIKITTDGSPQGKTAYLSAPYLTPVDGCTKECKGFPAMTQDMINDLFLLCYKNNVQLYSHCNGDASIDMMIKAHEFAVGILGDKDRRTVIIHSQIMRPDQMQKYKEYKLFPSFFTNHIYYWGDIHTENLGTERANYLSPMKDAFDNNIICTNHTDCPVTPMDQLFLLWTSVNRISKTGKIIGAEQRITPYQGLLALTINGAYECFEEKTKGSIKVGKVADLIILDKNPLKINPLEIKDIKVKQTFKAGKSIYKL